MYSKGKARDLLFSSLVIQRAYLYRWTVAGHDDKMQCKAISDLAAQIEVADNGGAEYKLFAK